MFQSAEFERHNECDIFVESRQIDKTTADVVTFIAG